MITTPYFRQHGRVIFLTPVSGSFEQPLTKALSTILDGLPLLGHVVQCVGDAASATLTLRGGDCEWHRN